VSTPRIVKRQAWSARPPKGTPTTVPISDRTATCVHYDGAVPITVRTFADASALIRKDQDFHIDGRGYDDIGYNFLVISAPGITAIDGLIFEGRGRDILGAHCLNHNREWIGVQVAIGGSQKPSPKALASTRWLHVGFVAAAQHALGMKGHRDGFPTACPGEPLYAWVQAGMPVSATTSRRLVPAKKPTVTAWQTLLAFAPTRRDGIWGAATEERSQWMVTAARTKTGSLAGSADSTIRTIQRVIGTPDDGAWGNASRAKMTVWIKRAQVLLGVFPDGVWGKATQAAYAKFRRAHHH
jgi:hypothetical protein